MKHSVQAPKDRSEPSGSAFCHLTRAGHLYPVAGGRFRSCTCSGVRFPVRSSPATCSFVFHCAPLWVRLRRPGCGSRLRRDGGLRAAAPCGVNLYGFIGAILYLGTRVLYTTAPCLYTRNAPNVRNERGQYGLSLVFVPGATNESLPRGMRSGWDPQSQRAARVRCAVTRNRLRADITSHNA